MHTTHLLGAGALLAVLGWLATMSGNAMTSDGPAAPVPAPSSPPPVANGHLALVIEGDRDQLTITHANHKLDPWAGIAKGASSAWTLTIHSTDGTALAEIPLDMAPFDVSADRKGAPIQVEGCIVRDPRIAMLVAVPHFARAAAFTFERRDKGGPVHLGTVTAARVQELAGGGR